LPWWLPLAFPCAWSERQTLRNPVVVVTPAGVVIRGAADIRGEGAHISRHRIFLHRAVAARHTSRRTPRLTLVAAAHVSPLMQRLTLVVRILPLTRPMTDPDSTADLTSALRLTVRQGITRS
jgi:hypothetical protein